MLGVTAIAEQVTKLTEWVNSQAGAKPNATGATPAGKTGNPIMDFLAPMLQKIDLDKVIEGFTGGGNKAGSPFDQVDKKLLEETLKTARDTELKRGIALDLFAQELMAGKQVFRNKETGDVIIASPQKGAT